jgi:histone-lysine N-methyltransferase SETMAR
MALLQHENAPAHRARLTKEKLEDLQGIEVLPHPAYSQDLAPSDYHLFRSLAHFPSGRQFVNANDLETGCREFFASKPPEWYKHGIELLADRWHKTILHNGIYFEE